MSVGSVELANGNAGIGQVPICDESCARRAAGAVEAEGEGVDGTDAGEKILFRLSE